MAVIRLKELERSIRRGPLSAQDIKLQKDYDKRQADAYASKTIGKRGYIK